MQNSKGSSGINKTAQPNRKDPDWRQTRKEQDGSKQTRIDASLARGFGLHLLEKELHALPLLEIALSKGESLEEKYPGLIKMIDTESKQLQAISDLYAIVKAQGRYKNLKEPDWKENIQPIQVLLWLLRKLGPLADGAGWTVDTYLQAGKTRYRFVIFKDYHGTKLIHREEYLPLDFLPRLLKRDPALHDLIIDLLALVSSRTKVPLWDEDGDFSEFLKDLLDPPGTYAVYSLERQHKVYSTGPAGQYLKYFKQCRKTVTLESVIDKLGKYDPKSNRKMGVVWWIKKGIQLAELGGSIKQHSFVPNYVPGETISPYQQYKLIWSLHKNDILFGRTLSKMKKDMERGDFYPCMFSIAKPGQVLKPLKYDPFPEKLFEFLDEGIKHFCYRHMDYYYKDAFNNQQTPAEEFLGDEQTPGLKLLQAIELSEIKNQNK